MATQAEIDNAKAEARKYAREAADAAAAEGREVSAEELSRAKELQRKAEMLELAGIADDRDDYDEQSLREQANDAQERADEKRAKIAEAAGRDVAADARKRDADEMRDLQKIAVERDKSIKVRLDIGAVRQARELARLGVTAKDIGDALRHGNWLVPVRGSNGLPDVRAFQVGSGATYSPVVPTITAEMLYDFMEFIGGVRASGAEVYPALPLQQTEFPIVDDHNIEPDNANPVGELAAGAEVEDGLDKITLTPQPFRGLTKVSQAMLASNVVGFAAYIARQLGRSVGRDLENDFHKKAAVGGQQNGLLADVPTARTIFTGGNTTNPSRANYGKAMGRIDAAYHGAGDAVSMLNDASPGAGGVRWLMHSEFFFEQLVAAEATDGHLKYPMAEKGIHIGRPVGFSSFIAKEAAANAYLAVVGNFFDGYLIAEDGMVEITYDTSVEFESSQVVYKGECHADGAVRDARALAWIQSKPA